MAGSCQFGSSPNRRFIHNLLSVGRKRLSVRIIFFCFLFNEMIKCKQQQTKYRSKVVSNGSALFVPQEKLHVINQYTNSIEKSVADNQDVRRLICTLKLLFFYNLST